MKGVKTAVLPHGRSSGANIRAIAGGIMAKIFRHYQADVHKSIIRDQFIRTVNPIVGAKLRAILNELKRKEAGRE